MMEMLKLMWMMIIMILNLMMMIQVLSIQERILERSLDSENTDTELELGEGEKALVREMCNVSKMEGRGKEKCKICPTSFCFYYLCSIFLI
jgi:hypothetical protein